VRCADCVIYVDTKGDVVSSIKCCMLKKTQPTDMEKVIWIRCLRRCTGTTYRNINRPTVRSRICYFILCLYISYCLWFSVIDIFDSSGSV
jgi:hypothetical protein